GLPVDGLLAAVRGRRSHLCLRIHNRHAGGTSPAVPSADLRWRGPRLGPHLCHWCVRLDRRRLPLLYCWRHLRGHGRGRGPVPADDPADEMGAVDGRHRTGPADSPADHPRKGPVMMTPLLHALVEGPDVPNAITVDGTTFSSDELRDAATAFGAALPDAGPVAIHATPR